MRCVVITGAGRGFCAGQDLADMNMAQPVPAQLQELVGAYFNPLIRKLHAFPKPIVMAVNGIAAGAGANLALAGDLCIAKQSASFLQAFIHIGLVPDSGGTYFLPRSIGTARALAAAMLGEKMSAQAAMDAGMINLAVADDAFEAAVQAAAQKLAALPTRALVAIRQAIRHGGSLDAQLDMELDLQIQMAGTADCAEGVGAFLGKRKAVFTGK